MTRSVWVLMILAAVLAAGTGGYWIGHHDLKLSRLLPTDRDGKTEMQVPNGPVIYYRDPEGRPFYSLEPKLTSDGQSYRAVLANEDVSFDLQTRVEGLSAPAEPTGKRILYYRNPMGLPDVSPTPKKDSMGMDYIPVYEGEDDDGSSIKISPGRLQRIGVKSEAAEKRIVAQSIRAPGIIQLDERRIAVISLRAEAFVESVENVTTGSEVRKGQKLMQLYSPAITSAAAQFLTAPGMQGSTQRLLNFAVPPQLLRDIERTKQVPITLTWTAPRDGVVLERNVVEGMRVMPGDVLFRIADQSVVWALVDVAERDIAALAENQSAIVRVRSHPNMTFPGKVALVYPRLTASTRTVRVRIEIANPDFALRPEMYAEAEIDTGSGQANLSVPDSAVIDSGDRQLVIVDRGEGRFEPRSVRLGHRGGGFVEVREGIAEGETVVTSANFLIDAESNLKSALKSLTAGASP